jgi:hypothetical protein
MVRHISSQRTNHNIYYFTKSGEWGGERTVKISPASYEHAYVDLPTVRKLESHKLDRADSIQLQDNSARDAQFPTYDLPGMFERVVSDGLSAKTTARPLYVRD